MVCLTLLSASAFWPLRVSSQRSSDNTNLAAPNAQKSNTAEKGFRLKPVSLLFHRWKSEKVGEFSFSLQKDDKDSLKELRTQDLRVVLDGREVKLGPNALRTTAKDPIKVLLLIDGSLSMINEKTGFNKLAAAKQSLIAFVDNLGSSDQAAIYAFDATLTPLLSSATSDKDELRQLIRGFAPTRESESAFSTNLYAGIDGALKAAKSQGIHYLVVCSDGMQDSPDSPDPLSLAFAEYKTRNEGSVAALARANGVRIFSVPIGDKNSEPKSPKNLNYVDADTLCNIATADPHGLCRYIDLRRLKTEALAGDHPLQPLLERELKTALEKIREAFAYSYTLDVPLGSLPQDGRSHELTISTVRTPTWPNLSVTYPLMWRISEAVPLPEPPRETLGIFLDTPKAIVSMTKLAIIYVSIVGVLMLFSFVPLISKKAQNVAKRQGQVRALKTSVFKLDAKSPLIGKRCPNEESVAIKAGDVVVQCPLCQRVHHLDCWQYSMFRCMVRHCAGELPIPDVILQKYGMSG